MSGSIRVDRTACQAYGLCSELLPERIELDEWGYPILDARPLPAGLIRHARRAAEECPVRAFRLTLT
jgi:ferredoxin